MTFAGLSIAAGVVLILLLFIYIIWLRNQLKRVVLTSNGLYEQLSLAREDRDKALQNIEQRILKNKEIEDVVAEIEALSKTQKIYIISRLK